MTKLFSSIALAALLASSGTAQAQSANGDDVYVETISHADLNLASPSGLASFRARVKAAATRVCGQQTVIPLFEANAVAKCRTGFLRSAEAQISLALRRDDGKIVGTR